MTNREGRQAARGRVGVFGSMSVVLWMSLALPAQAVSPTDAQGSTLGGAVISLAPGAVAPAIGKELRAPSAASDPWHACLAAAERIERDEKLPEQMLAAVTTVETGWSKPGAGLTRYPWPWTVTAQGRGRHYPTKEAAIEAVRALFAAGVNSVDVGCMQINLFYHPRAFTGLEEAFEPHANMRYAISFLRRLKETFGSWESALEHYHSYDPERRQDYRTKIFTAWSSVQSRREQFRQASGISAAPVGAETLLAETTEADGPLLGERAGREDRNARIELPGDWRTPAPILAASASLLVPVEPDAEDVQQARRGTYLGPSVIIPVDLAPRPSDRLSAGLEGGRMPEDARLASAQANLILAARSTGTGQAQTGSLSQ